MDKQYIITTFQDIKECGGVKQLNANVGLNIKKIVAKYTGKVSIGNGIKKRCWSIKVRLEDGEIELSELNSFRKEWFPATDLFIDSDIKKENIGIYHPLIVPRTFLTLEFY